MRRELALERRLRRSLASAWRESIAGAVVRRERRARPETKTLPAGLRRRMRRFRSYGVSFLCFPSVALPVVAEAREHFRCVVWICATVPRFEGARHIAM